MKAEQRSLAVGTWFAARATALMICVLLAACAPPPAPPPEPLTVTGRAGDLPARRLEVVSQALAMTGQPYRSGGAAPGGFDCSGLVTYAYAQAGFRLPRRVIEQAGRARRLPPTALQPGDLLFFRIDGTISHVGIYMGDGRMVHAPSSGKTVRVDTIDARYWAPRYAGAIPMQQLLADAS
ncbi:MAG TPA: C40 family peptidase [Candidatus Acidoferrales bacterium]|nr:C40 family peptidase [Candidatus Acidoferrales bacterium]